MAKIKYILVIVIFGLFTTFIVSGATSKQNQNGGVSENYQYIEQMVLESSRFTQTDSVDPAILANYKNNFTLSYTQAELDFLGYEVVLEDDDLKVYLELKSFSVVILNKATGYYWSSRAEFQHLANQPESNAFRNQMNSGIWVEYIRTKNNSGVPLTLRDSNIATESLYRIAGVAYQSDENLIENFPGCESGHSSSNICPQIIIPERYNESNVKVTKLSETANSITAGIDVKSYGFKFNVKLSLENGVFKAFIDNSSISESDDRFSLLGIYLFPYMGSTRLDSTPGYFLIPDGVGTLVRLNNAHNTSFQSRFYGSDLGYNSTTNSSLNIPIYGVVHEVGENAFYVNITEGSAQSILYATFYGTNSRYNFIRSKYIVRELFIRVVDSQGLTSGALTAPTAFTKQNYELSYKFLSHDEASYVGIAKDYRSYLTDLGILTELTEKNTDVKLHMNFLMADNEPAFIGTRSIRMTRVKDVLDIYETIKSSGITNQMVSLHGWSNDGNGVMLARTSLNESRSAYNNLRETIEADGNHIYLANNYIMANDSHRVNYISDVSRSISRLKMSYTNLSFTGQRSTIDMLYPDRSFLKAQADVNFYDRLGYGVELRGIGDTLFSYYDGGIIERTVSLESYQNLVNLFDNVILSNPNLYLWAYTNHYLDMAVTNSQYNYYTDLVPLLPIILAGSMEYFTPYLNFNALGIERLLMMIDFNINPSYMLTQENTYKMRYTKSNHLYTTTYADFKDQIVTDYQFLNNALKHVRGYYIKDREVISTGIVKVTYDNGVSIYINYGDRPFVADGIVLVGKSYEVVL